MNKKKIFNDPLYGLIMFQHEVLYEIIDHPYFQRLRRISQQALSHYVYPGAMHTRFQHALGSLFLMTKALEVLKSKGHHITNEENEAVCIAILLHDIGHGPFSHALEHTIVDLHHETISMALIQRLEVELGRDFKLAIRIFKGEYHRHFLHQLVSGQIDVDRMDYLMRDSYYSGVAEGIIGYDRIIMMMNIVDNQLVIEEKGLYSIEKFLLARRLMYWQVYLHKTVVAAESMLISILERARYLVLNGVDVQTTPSLGYLLRLNVANKYILDDNEFINNYVNVDDVDILAMIKGATLHSDYILRYLCNNLLVRKLFKLSLRSENCNGNDRIKMRNDIMNKEQLSDLEVQHLFTEKEEKFYFYDPKGGQIMVLLKNGTIKPYEECVDIQDKLRPEITSFQFVPY
jgi:uncharacterized protein